MTYYAHSLENDPNPEHWSSTWFHKSALLGPFILRQAQYERTDDPALLPPFALSLSKGYRSDGRCYAKLCNQVLDAHLRNDRYCRVLGL